NIAIEMAAQLEQAGEKTGILAFLDCGGPLGLFTQEAESISDIVPEFTMETEKQFIKKFLTGIDTSDILDAVNDPAKIWPTIVEYLKSNEEYLKQIITAISEQGMLAVQATMNYGQIRLEDALQYINLSRSLINAAARYLPTKKIDTPLYFFNALKGGRGISEAWQDYCREPVIYHKLNGDHYSILRSPVVEVLARIITGIDTGKSNTKANSPGIRGEIANKKPRKGEL
ncbi:MAG: hypothetical protein GY757_26515, partial [bacterium]|nr:hypothetical protein [bacterium]